MSFDPYGTPDQPPPPGQPPRGPGGPPGGNARERVMTPAILLIALSVLNLLATLYALFNLATTAAMPAEQIHERVVGIYEQMSKSDNPMLKDIGTQSLKQLQEQGPGGIKRQALLYSGVSSGLGVLITLLGLLGGIRMMQLRSFGLAMTGAIATAIPCLSVSGCCCGAGQAVALWCIIVLMNPEVRASFK